MLLLYLILRVFLSHRSSRSGIFALYFSVLKHKFLFKSVNLQNIFFRMIQYFSKDIFIENKEKLCYKSAYLKTFLWKSLYFDTLYMEMISFVKHLKLSFEILESTKMGFLPNVSFHNSDHGFNALNRQ